MVPEDLAGEYRFVESLDDAIVRWLVENGADPNNVPPHAIRPGLVGKECLGPHMQAM